MNPDRDRSIQGPTPPDDEQLGALVRSIADDWRMPPQRLDQPTWRDRMDTRTKRPRRGWIVRLVAPATAAVAGSVIIAFVAVWLTAPRPDRAIVGASPSASIGRPSPASSSRPAASTLPGLFQNGALPSPARVLVRAGDGYQIADLSSGKLSTVSIQGFSGPTTVVSRPGGGWLCICADWTGMTSGGSPTGVDATLETIDATGAALSNTHLRAIKGEPDPAVSMTALFELADMRVSVSADGRYAFVGWTARQGAAGWTAGIDVVDVTAGSVIGSLPLPLAEPTAGAGAIVTRAAPRVDVAPSGRTILLSSFWFVEDSSPFPPSGTDHWSAPLDGGTIGSLKPAAATAEQSCGELDSGLIDSTMYYVVCWKPDGQLIVERNGVDGSPVDQTELPRIENRLEGGSLVARSGDVLYLWDPVTPRIIRFDLHLATVDSATATAAVQSAGPLEAVAAAGRRLGRWLAPAASAKTMLDPALAVSPDGTRVYAIGIESISPDGSGGSRGIYVFDARTLDPVGHWTPTADFASLAISPDGRFVYAAGLFGRDAAGNDSRDSGSITVYDTTDGSIRLIAGKLGGYDLYFPGPTVR
jgi:hypothetical protein